MVCRNNSIMIVENMEMACTHNHTYVQVCVHIIIIIKRNDDLLSFQLHLIIDFVLTERKLSSRPG